METVRTRLAHTLVFAAMAAMLGACGGDDTATPSPTNNELEPDAGMTEETTDAREEPQVDMAPPTYPDVAAPPIPRSVETDVTSPLRAGDILDVTCRLIDDGGNVVEPEPAPELTFAVAPSGSFQRVNGEYVAVRVGTATVRCAAPEYGFVDQTPAEVEILPGDAFTSVIEVDKTQMVAGDVVAATCRFLDEFGNEVDPSENGATPELSVTPSGGGIDVTGLTAQITVADIYAMSCYVPGLTNEQSVNIEVIPDLPATLVVNAQPNQQVYGLGQVVSLSWIVTDQYGNVIPNAVVSTSVSPMGGVNSFGNGRFRFEEEGTFSITVTVEGMTQGGADVSRTITVIVNGEGPGITCESPGDGTMLDITPGSAVTFGGSVSDANGVQSVLVNGSGVAVNADGTFQAQVTTQWGMNFVEVVATDQFGEENSRTCSFLASDYYQSQNTYMDDSVALKLLQSAVDDGSRSGGITSLADLLWTVLNSDGLLDQVDSALKAADPLLPFTCESQTCIFGFCVCWFGYGVDYRDQLRVQGSRTVSLDLVPGGVAAQARINDLGVYINADYVISEIPGSTRGWVDTDFIDVRMTLDLGLDNNNNPRASIRPGSVQVNVGGIDTSFDGLDGAIVNVVISLFQGTVQDLIADTIRDFITGSFGDVIDGVVASLDINTLGSTLNLPALDGSGDIGTRFNLQFSRMNLDNSRMAVGIGTRFTPVQTRNGNPTLGVARQHATGWSEPNNSDPVAVGVYVGLLNHVLHALWRGGLFDATLSGTNLGGGLPDDAQAVVQASLPPVVQNLNNGTVQLGLGGLYLAVTYPGVFNEPLNVSLGAIATSSVTLVGDELVFGNVSIDELYFSTPDVSLDATTRGVLEGFLLNIVQSFVDTSLNQSLPALPIPSFAIPASLSQYGLPANAELGINGATLETTTRQYILEGSFGVR